MGGVAVYFDPIVLGHDTGPHHPETSERLTACLGAIREAGYVDSRPGSPERTLQAILRLHEDGYVERFRSAGRRAEIAQRGRLPSFFDSPDNPIGPATFDAATRTVGLTLAAVDAVLSGEARAVFVASRPPGHHALAAQAMGFCYFNTIAVAARDLVARAGLSRVLIADFDVHHGNGTQDLFWTDGSVGYVSVHRFPFYPGTGSAGETGSGDGLGATVNVPLPGGATESAYVDGFRRGLETLASRLKPELVLVSAGFDAHVDDPLGGMRVTEEGYGSMTRALRDVAAVYSGGRLVSLLEGGYDPDALGRAAVAHIENLIG